MLVLTRALGSEEVNKHSAGRIIVQPPAMAPHENLFHVEKHYNDTLYKGQRHGTSHTDKEIQAAANLLGRDSVVADERTALRNVKVSLFFIFPYRYGQLVRRRRFFLSYRRDARLRKSREYARRAM